MERVVVTGATGFLGRHLLPILQERYGQRAVRGLSSRDYDLMDPMQVQRMFDDIAPNIVVHLAAYSGGIGANRTYPGDFFYRNILLTALMFEEASKRGVRKLVYPMGGCSYPATATSPIDEGQMWLGYPQEESAGYSMAKKMGIVASRAYRAQHGLSSVVLVPGNMYGEYDNYRESESHVVPAMIRRFLEAKRERRDRVMMWGTGTPVRDFVYAGDVAATFPFFVEEHDASEPVNVSSGTRTSIRELANTIAELTGYAGSIVWDSTKPDGQMVKLFDVSKMWALDLACPTNLRDGLARTIAWFERNYDARGDGLRL
jgi:GDP-L-fucose synthase